MATILDSKQIQAEVDAGRLIHGANSENINGCSYDMTVGTIFWEGEVFRPTGNVKQVTVPPGGVIGIFTKEELRLPDDICATAFAINEMSSKGFLVLNPGHVDPGFDGALTVKALNVRRTNTAIEQGEPIFTVVFQRLDRSTTSYNNKSREERERKFNKETVETSPKSLGQIIEVDTNGPFPGRAEVDRRIRSHWLSITTFVFTGLTFLGATVGAVAAVLALYRETPTSGGSRTLDTTLPRGEVHTVNVAPASPATPAPISAPLHDGSATPGGAVVVDLVVPSSRPKTLPLHQSNSSSGDQNVVATGADPDKGGSQK